MTEKHTYWHKSLKTEEAGHGVKWKSKRKVWYQKNDDSQLGNGYSRTKYVYRTYNF